MNIQFVGLKNTEIKKQIGLQRARALSGNIMLQQRDMFKVSGLRFTASSGSQEKLWASCLAKNPNLDAIIDALSGDDLILMRKNQAHPDKRPE